MLLRALLVCLLGAAGLPLAQADWRTADRSSAGIAPDPAVEARAVVQVYAARTYGWRRSFAVHSWVATKEAGAKAYDVYHVIGWRIRGGQSVVSIDQSIPDGRWFGAEPELLADLR